MNPPDSILYDARTVRPGMSGVGRYALNLLAALAAHPGAPRIRTLFLESSLEFARKDPALAGVECIAAPASHEAHPAGDLWLRFGVRRVIRPGELYHGPAFIIPGGAQPFARVVTIHDLFVLTHPKTCPLKFRIWLRWATARACRFADRIITPTATVRDEIVRRGLATPDRIAAIAEAPDATNDIWDSDSCGKKSASRDLPTDPARPRIISVGTLDPRKDPRTARAAFVKLDGLLPTAKPAWIWFGGAGAMDDGTPPELKNQAETLGFHCVGHASRGALGPAYKAAAVYVSCSRAEGFGIPLVEAMAAGCPVVASDIAVHREVAGDAALYFPEGDAAALAAALARVLGDGALREDLARRGLARAWEFSWAKAAAATLDVYRAADEEKSND